jgi:biopolymer transport protein ExbD
MSQEIKPTPDVTVDAPNRPSSPPASPPAGPARNAAVPGSAAAVAEGPSDDLDEAIESVKLGRAMDDSESDMDMTPMVDVTFLLLIFFMVTAAFSLQKSIEIPAPKDNSPSTRAVPEEQEEDPSSVTVQVDEFNTFHVLTPEAEWECPSEQELLMRLREAGREATKMLVKANAEAELQYVVMALDAGTEVGMEQVQLMTVEEDD